MTDQTPRTEAGRWLVIDLSENGMEGRYESTILAIEAQARTEALDVGVLLDAIVLTVHAETPFTRTVAERIADRYRAILEARRDEG